MSNNDSQPKLEIEVSGVVYTKRDVIEISPEIIEASTPQEDSGIVTSVEIVKALREINEACSKASLEKPKSIESLKSSFMAFLEDSEDNSYEIPNIIFALCKTWEYLFFTAYGNYTGLAKLGSYYPSYSKIKEVEDLIEKYSIDLSLGSNDLYIGLDKESGLWLETYI